MHNVQLNPGQCVLVTPLESENIYNGIFIERLPKGVSVFILEDFVGLTGPDDIGDVYLSDSMVSRCVKPAEAH